ncbi:MAG: hypothetical protein ABI844_00810 [Saprospiraceae bacterium]
MKKKEDPKVNKKRVVKDYDKLSPELLKIMHDTYPDGFAGALISFFDRDGKRVSAIPFETEEIYYLIRWVEKKSKPAKEEDDIDVELETEVPSDSDDEIFDDGEEAESGGDVSLDDMENAENTFADDDNY